jgi:hypothetical protein
MVKLGIFIHKADHVLLNSFRYKMTSLAQDRARHDKTGKSPQGLLGQTIKILYKRGRRWVWIRVWPLGMIT